MSDKEIALILACDDGYFFHLKNLLLSIARNAPSLQAMDKFCISPGMAPEHVEFIRSHGVTYVPIGHDAFDGPLRQIVAQKPYTFCQFIRPLFPRIVTGYEHLLYLDCDIWVQDDRLLPVITQALTYSPRRVVAAPLISHYYESTIISADKNLEVQRNWVHGGYDIVLAEAIANRTFFSSGLFALPARSPFWDLWWQEVLEVAPRIQMVNREFIHFAEQTAFNGVIARHGLATVLDPLYNFHCNAGGVARSTNTGKVCSVMSKPMQEICVVHLAGWSGLQDSYRERRLVYEE
ncbi:glycosyltransferase [Niveispirillum sp. KHB5.9]|uniref:glycosyltransferase n=1 Tax=Niveispirillum sp. KHB5.9 TaxID=3400269 RepID=UPI003A88036D